MPDLNIALISIVFLIAMNNVLAMAEAALLAARKARLQQRVNEGDRNAGIALKLIENPNQFLAVIQIGITLIDVLTGAITGATIAVVFTQFIEKIPILAPYSVSIGLALGVLIITYFSIILGELVPKRLAIQNPEKISSGFARPMLFLTLTLSPVVRFLSISTNFVLRLIGVRPSNEPPVTEEEIHVLLDQGTQAGVFEEAEQDMVAGVFKLNDRRLNTLMTPRTEILWLDVLDTNKDILIKLAERPFSRFPVCQGSLDNVLGIANARDLLTSSLSGDPIQLKDNLSPSLFIPETAFASSALDIFKESNKKMVLVIDEFGGVTGLLTINDVLEVIVGDIEDDAPQVTQRQDGSWLLDGMLDINEFKELFDLGPLPNEDDYETLAGFIMTSIGNIPQTADQFEWQGLRFEVVDMDVRRVDKVLVTTMPARPLPNTVLTPEEVV
ncbi:MAG: hemolysin family protein [Anaerolineae bacterium]|nr:hemolysin family protein [Anaerolineae bacterium]